MNAHQVAWLFPGQGSQKVGMGRILWEAHPVARQTFEEADQLLGMSLSKLMFDGPKELLDDTINTQSALYVHSMALLRVAQAEGWLPAAGWVAGHSMGEYSALTAAGALPFADGLKLVRERGQLMKSAGEYAPGSMAAIIRLDEAIVAQLCAEASIEGELAQIANYNCPGQLVISGTKQGVAQACAAAKAAGARKVVPLDVSIGAHTPLMARAMPGFTEQIEMAQIEDAQIPIIANVTAQPLRNVADIREELLAQLMACVRWTDSMRFLVDQGVSTVIEIGAGKVLTGLMKRINRNMTRWNIASWQDLMTLAEK